jgi:hypothetical protein
VTSTDLSNLETKTQNFQLSTVPNNTICVGTLATSTLAANFLTASGRVTISPSIDPVAVEVGLTGSMGTGYSLPRVRGLEGQGLIQGTLGTVQFTDVADPAELETVLTRTQYQSTTELQTRLTTFDGRLRLQPTPGGDAKQVIFPESRANFGGASLRTNMSLSQSDLIWQSPTFIRRFQNVLGDPTLSTVFALPSIPGVDITFMTLLTGESKSANDVWSYNAITGLTYTGTSIVATFRVSFSASLTILNNPAPAYIKIRITRADSLGGPQTEMQRRAFIIRRDSDPNLVYLEAVGAGLTPNSVINVYVSDYNQSPTLRIYDAVVDVMTY